MESFKDLVDQNLRKAKPLTRGVGLFKSHAPSPTLHPKRLPQEIEIRHISQALTPEEFESVAAELEGLKAKTDKVVKRSHIRPWMGQAVDCLSVWALASLFPLIAKLVLPVIPSRAFLAPSVVALFTLGYVVMLAGYFWAFNFFKTPTLGMMYMEMEAWPVEWSWPPQKFLPALKRAIGHLSLDTLWRKR